MPQISTPQTVGRSLPFTDSPRHFGRRGFYFSLPLSLYYWCFWWWPHSDYLLWQAYYTEASSPSMTSVAEHNRNVSLAPAVCLLSFGGDLSHVSLTGWWSCHHLEIAGGCSRKMGSKMLLTRWISAHIALITEGHRQCWAGKEWETIILFCTQKWRGNRYWWTRVCIILDSLPPRGAALFVNTFALTKHCPFSFILPKHH